MLRQIKDFGIEKTIPDNSDLIPFQQADGISGHITREDFLLGISGGSTIEYAQIADLKTSGINGGSYPTARVAITRDLNTIVSSATWLSLIANVFTLQAGTYLLNAIVPAIYVGNFKAWVQNASNNNIILLGTSQYSSEGSPYVTASSVIKGKIIVASETEYSIKFWASNGRSQNYVLGIAAGISGQAEVYTQVDITKVSQ
jgi:hypothetical protein